MVTSNWGIGRKSYRQPPNYAAPIQPKAAGLRAFLLFGWGCCGARCGAPPAGATQRLRRTTCHDEDFCYDAMRVQLFWPQTHAKTVGQFFGGRSD